MSKPAAVVFEETFPSEQGVDDRWHVLQRGGFRADDGVVTMSKAGMSVAPPGRHPQAGTPAFTKTGPGALGHLKWSVHAARQFATGEGPLRFGFRAGARTFGVADHPFGDDVADPATDLRLGAATLNVADYASGVIFDFWITEKAIYPFYERLRIAGVHGDHHAFASIAEPLSRVPEADHDLAVILDAPAGVARWEIDGQLVAEVAPIGPSHPAWRTILDHGGTPERVTIERVEVGLGLLTLLDASLTQSDRALVDLETGYAQPRTFRGGPALWGQGAELRISRVQVTRV